MTLGYIIIMMEMPPYDNKIEMIIYAQIKVIDGKIMINPGIKLAQTKADMGMDQSLNTAIPQIGRKFTLNRHGSTIPNIGATKFCSYRGCRTT